MGHVLRFQQPEGSPEDIARERRIAGYVAGIQRAGKLGAWGMKTAMELQERMTAEIAARSPAQIERMERARGLWP